MNDKIITVDIENMDTGEKSEMEHYVLFPNYGLIFLARIVQDERN